MYKKYFKRLLDIVLSLFGLVILSPVFIIVTVLLFFANKGKPFFFQERPGKDEKIFKVIKFKTMNDKKDFAGNLSPDDQRITKIGNFVRSFSLDEIPQLLNVIKGDMSLVGPRPLSVKYLSLYDEKQKRRHEVRPGITGLAQVNGRASLLFSKRFEYDVRYVDNLNFLLDFKIFFMTIKNILSRKDIGAGATGWKSFDDLGFQEKSKK
jgi:lipopolysaccharide/colanic/teichoic acid biosynthesis glycosyltransferase